MHCIHCIYAFYIKLFAYIQCMLFTINIYICTQIDPYKSTEKDSGGSESPPAGALQPLWAFRMLLPPALLLSSYRATAAAVQGRTPGPTGKIWLRSLGNT